MKNLIIEKVTRISVYLTAEQWGAVRSESPLMYRAHQAQRLNQLIAEYVNRGECRRSTATFATSMMKDYAEYGFYTVDTLLVLNAVLNEVYGDQE